MRRIALVVLAFFASHPGLAHKRFDFTVREDVFASMDGARAAFDRAVAFLAK